MTEIYNPIEELQKELTLAISEVNNYWRLNQIKLFIANIQKED